MNMKKLFAVMFVLAFLISSFAVAGSSKYKTATGKQVKPKTVKERVTFKSFNPNDPSLKSDNTVTFIKDGKEIERPIHESWNEEHLKMFRDQDVNLTSNIIPQTGDYVVTDVVPFAY